MIVVDWMSFVLKSGRFWLVFFFFFVNVVAILHIIVTRLSNAFHLDGFFYFRIERMNISLVIALKRLRLSISKQCKFICIQPHGNGAVTPRYRSEMVINVGFVNFSHEINPRKKKIAISSFEMRSDIVWHAWFKLEKIIELVIFFHSPKRSSVIHCQSFVLHKLIIPNFLFISFFYS